MLVRPVGLVPYICARCATRPATLTRLLYTVARDKSTPAAYSSFFFHNAQWSTAASSRPTSVPTTHFARQVALPQSSAVPEDARPLAGYRPTEVLTPRRLANVYVQLAKSRLTVLVVLTAMAGVAVSPLPATVPVLLSTAVGTVLCSASANAFNQIQEVPFDAQMARTRMRPLVRKAISPLHASCFAVATGGLGTGLLWTMVNPTTAILGAANIVLYAGAYTYLKRTSVWNTWVGAVVGAIPPLMGWTACGGQLLPSSAQPIELFWPSFMSSVQTLDPSLIDNPLSAFALFMLLFSWQFPHFNSLSHIVRNSYAQAGYHMLSVISPKKNSLVAFRHAIILGSVCSVLIPISGLTTWTFALTSLIPNILGIRAAWAFWRFGGEQQARAVWQHSLWYLPVVLGLMMFHKQGLDWTAWFSGDGESRADAEETGGN
ncbi:hypothetical protein PHLGIDRAFT_100217 [Phlebiopsis gigantea 11061_1 CR5-6]|uniref:Protoheme IX farnesyltransferase, mitochondrial n=1 Tax=Phlebiopsis gigantea (strain 11061_1 CR5-6) TaxID=745531 RepID=A0A0C3SCI9_PHLG1|nr:hypothetical protein PHLGIDRAFT_100217 [Phlebiopsis gigantea 11061_1 CR5-6]